MKTDYDATDDILVMHFSDKPVTREVSQDWNLNIAYADDGSIVEIVILDAKAPPLGRYQKTGDFRLPEWSQREALHPPVSPASQCL